MNFLSQVFVVGDADDVFSIVGATMVLICIIAITLEPGQKNDYHALEEQDQEVKDEAEKSIGMSTLLS